VSNTTNPFTPNVVASDLKVGDYFYAETFKRVSGYVNKRYTVYVSYRVLSVDATTNGLTFQVMDQAGNTLTKAYRAGFARLERFTPSDAAKAVLWK
jgi:hypothetical protein